MYNFKKQQSKKKKRKIEEKIFYLKRWYRSLALSHFKNFSPQTSSTFVDMIEVDWIKQQKKFKKDNYIHIYVSHPVNVVYLNLKNAYFSFSLLPPFPSPRLLQLIIPSSLSFQITKKVNKWINTYFTYLITNNKYLK